MRAWQSLGAAVAASLALWGVILLVGLFIAG